MDDTQDNTTPPDDSAKPDPLSSLTEKQRLFVLSYVEHGNGARAAREAGYAEKHARIEAAKLLKKPAIKAAIGSFMEEHGMSAGECIGRLTHWARGSLEPFIAYVEEVQYNPLTGTPFLDTHSQPVTKLTARLDLTSEEARANLHLLKKIKQGPHGLEIELTDPKDAVDKLLQVHGRYKTKLDLSLLSEQQIDELLEKALAKLG
ncbi:terminase small subunit [Spirosoma koreense]